MKDDLGKYSIFVVGLLIICFSIYFFMFLRGFPFSFSFFIIVAICLFLICITFFQDKIIHLFFEMKISDMDLNTAQHYHSMITNIILGFSAVVGIGITLLWPSQGNIWRTNNFGLYVVLLIYFIYVMYFIFLKKLRHQIMIKNKKAPSGKYNERHLKYI